MNPQKIISLVPSLTELLIDFGLQNNLIGRTRFCIHPEEIVSEIPVVGGTKNPNLEKIVELNPDLIIANKEENRKEDIEFLRDKFRTLVTNISCVEDALLAIYELGTICGAEKKAKELTTAIQSELEDVPPEPVLETAYFIWKNPWMTVGRDTYIHSVMEHFHLKNIFADQTRYPVVELSDLEARKPELILLSSEPYPFKEKHVKEIEDVCNSSKVVLADGEWFSWYGSRMLESFQKLKTFRKAIS
jgi:ABC-type Fe3+-hydroxamate transport system substrate-binding protein